MADEEENDWNLNDEEDDDEDWGGGDDWNVNGDEDDDEDWGGGDDDDEGDWGDADDLMDEDDVIFASAPSESSKPPPKAEVEGGISLLDIIKSDESRLAAGDTGPAKGFADDLFELRREEEQNAQFVGYFKTVYKVVDKLIRGWDTGMSDKELREQIKTILTQLRKDVPAVKPEAKGSKETKHCTVCFSEFDDGKNSSDEPVVNVAFANCGHCGICTSCYKRYVSIRIRDKETTPWIPCPFEDCDVYITAQELIDSGVSTQELYDMAKIYLYKHLARQRQWVECVKEKCSFGFLMGANAATKKDSCAVCGLEQDVKKKDIQLDPEFVKLKKEGKIRNCPQCDHPAMRDFGLCNVMECGKCGVWWSKRIIGKIRNCPQCDHPAMRDFGLCNVMECGKCGVWWNWRTRETGRNSRDLKAKARAEGSLWEPGELDYQRKLQRENLPAFKALLERNGIKYDPNYRRGTG